MDRVVNLAETVRQVVDDYVCPSPNATMYLMENPTEQVYAAMSVPHLHKNMTRVVVLARVKNDRVIIETDITDKPLYEALVQAGIPQQQIVRV